MRRKNVFILGSTGTIGINTLKVIERFPERFSVCGLTAYHNLELIEKQVKKFSPSYVAVGQKGIGHLKGRLNRTGAKIFDVEHDLPHLVTQKDVDVVVIGMSGSAALKPFFNAVKAGKTVTPANKEALVMAGDILMRSAKRYGAKIIPIDSEQSAIFQCLDGRNRDELSKVYLTASGGALYKISKSNFARLKVKQILKHPRWKMGKKITVDSATLMNKGFEIIEAKHLFGLDVNDIEVVVHPEAIIHSMVEFKDGSIIAQLGVTDMRLPIQYALTYPERLKTNLKSVEFFKLKQLTFNKPDFHKFPCLGLSMFAGRKGGTLPTVLNAADEIVVQAFLTGKISFLEIYQMIEKIVLKHKVQFNPSLEEILAADQEAREETQRLIFNE